MDCVRNGLCKDGLCKEWVPHLRHVFVFVPKVEYLQLKFFIYQLFPIPCFSHTARPAATPEAQAHWKLNPPSCPVTSTTSPIKYSPGTARASIVRACNSSVSTPPAVTSAFSKPSVPAGCSTHRCSLRSQASSAAFDQPSGTPASATT